MTALRVVIVDDEPLARERLRGLLDAERDVEVVGEVEDGASAVEWLRRRAPDVVFLDVQMPGMTGFDVVREVGADRMPVTVFVTAHDRFALDAFEASAIDYLVKPFAPARLRDALRRARAQVAGRRGAAAPSGAADGEARTRRPPGGVERLMVRRGETWQMVRTADVAYARAADNYVELHAGKAVHLLRGTLGELETRLDPRRFIRVHRGLLVNVEYVRTLQPWGSGEYVVTLADGTQLQTSRTYRANVRALIDGDPGAAE